MEFGAQSFGTGHLDPTLHIALPAGAAGTGTQSDRYSVRSEPAPLRAGKKGGSGRALLYGSTLGVFLASVGPRRRRCDGLVESLSAAAVLRRNKRRAEDAL